MIRIDEIYSNVFLPLVKDKKYTALHWFDPFGSTNFHNLCSYPIVDGIANRYIFWDQEPLHQDRTKEFFDQFTQIYYDGPLTIVHSEYNSKDVSWLENTYNLKSCYYFFHGWAALDWYRGYNRSFLHQIKNIQHTFLCPNNIVGGKRKHRLDFFNELCQRNLVADNLVSMPEFCPYEKIPVRKYINHNVDLPLKIDEFDNYATNSHQITMWEQSAKTLLQVVTETSYAGKKNHLTEKTFKPIVLQQPFIIVGNCGSLRYLKKYGFKTFSDVWDESYDDVDDDTRIQKIANLLEELEQADKTRLYESCLPIIKHNYDWFYSGGFERVLWDELLEMVNQW
jgi:hypothetical protein